MVIPNALEPPPPHILLFPKKIFLPSALQPAPDGYLTFSVHPLTCPFKNECCLAMFALYREDDQRDGLGVYFYADGGRYEGGWEASKQSGEGVMSYANGEASSTILFVYIR